MKRWLARRAWRAATTCAVNELRARDAFMAQRPKLARVSAAPCDPLLALPASRFDRNSQNSDRFTRKESSSQSVGMAVHDDVQEEQSPATPGLGLDWIFQGLNPWRPTSAKSAPDAEGQAVKQPSTLFAECERRLQERFAAYRQRRLRCFRKKRWGSQRDMS
jgi:hypothetical protein